MKKHILILFLILAGIYSCSKDDFCSQEITTPKLILRFYNKDTIYKTKNVERLSVIAQGKTDSLSINQTLDSISIPLNSLSKKTVYTLKINSTDGAIANNQTATLTVNYNVKEEFVSRSCGYRFIFNNVTISKTGWINKLSTYSIQTINNQNTAHVKVYH